MIGISYTAGVCYDAARAAPDALKAIVVCQMCSDWYQGVVAPGGSPRPFIWENYAPLMAAYQFAPPDPAVVGDDWERLWQERLDGSRPWGLAYAENLHDGEFWDSRLLRGREERVKAATFLIGGWCDWYPDDMLRVFSRLKCPKRAIIGPWTHNYPENAWPLPRINDRYECLRWFDRYLKDKDTEPERPIGNETPINLFVREHSPPEILRREDPGRWIELSEWPPNLALLKQLALAPEDAPVDPSDPPGNAVTGTKLTLAYDPAAGRAAGRYAIGQMLPGWGMAGDQREEEPHSLCFTLTNEVSGTVLGAPEIQFSFSCSAAVVFISAKLCDVSPDGSSVLITKGGSILSRGELTTENGDNDLAVIQTSFETAGMFPDDGELCHELTEIAEAAGMMLTSRLDRGLSTPFAAGKEYIGTLQLQATAHRLHEGHRLRLMLAAADFQNYWPTPFPHMITLNHVWLRLPVSELTSSEPRFLASDFPPTPPEQMNLPEYSITHDLVADALETRIVTKAGCGVNRSRYRIHRRDPANAVVESEYEYPLDREGFSALVKSRCETRSDAESFEHRVAVEITLNGERYWEREWATRVKRNSF
jgi:putative CocE/NonD family hydrolase